MNIDDEEYKSISPTAIITSYPRIFTDIPYEKEIFEWLSKNTTENIILNKMLAPEIEARYKLTNRLLEKNDIKQVLELASGYSSRGLRYAEKGYKYIEMDLKDVTNNKKQILNSFTKIPENLHILSGNALKIEDFYNCEKYLDKNQKLAIINEGLLRYLTFDEKKIVAENIHNILSKYGGVWITCDVTPKNFIKAQDKNLPNFNKNLSNVSIRNNINDRFENEEHIIKFFGDIGFDVEFHYFKEAKNELSSPDILKISSNEIDKLLEHAMVVVMRTKR